MSLLLILTNILLTTIISPINFYRAVFNSTLQHFSQWLWLRNLGYPHFLWPATLSQRGHSIITLSQNDQNLYPPLPCLHLFDFGNTPFCDCSPPPFQPHHYPIVKSCYFVDSWSPVITSTYTDYNHKKYSHNMNVPSILINTNGIYY